MRRLCLWSSQSQWVQRQNEQMVFTGESGNPDVSELVGRVIRKDIYMKSAELYALQFVNE